MSAYQEIYQSWLDNPEAFWAEHAKSLHWEKKWDRVLDDSDKPFYRWFGGGRLNICHNAVDRHVNDGYGSQTALLCDSSMTGKQQRISYDELLERVSRLAGALGDLGVKKGDRVLIYMPMIAEAVIGMLACARIGAVHSVVFGGFAANELSARIIDAEPALVLSASCGLEPGKVIDYKALLDEGLKLAAKPALKTLIKQRSQRPCELIEGRDFDWDETVQAASPAPCVDTAATDLLYILYTSGTTGQPKGVTRDHGGQAVSLYWSMKHIYDMNPGEVFWAASDIGWVVGHSYIVYGPLLNRNTTVVFEGKPVGAPDPGVFWRIIQEHRVKSLFTAPTAIRAIKREDFEGEFVKKYDLSGLRSIFLAGERCDPDTIKWLAEQLRVPVVDHWWQTETSWAIAGNPLGIEELPVKIGSCSKPMPGYRVEILDDEGDAVEAGDLGNIVIQLPLPPGTMVSIWRNKELHHQAYLSRFKGHYLTGDSGMIDDDGYLHVMSRIDDVINTAGHRLSTGQIEEILCDHHDVVEAATFGVRDELKGELPLALVELNPHLEYDNEKIYAELIKLVRDTLGPVAAFKLVVRVNRLPKTRSGKILRGTLRKIANGDPWKTPATIEEPKTLEEISAALATLGYPCS